MSAAYIFSSEGLAEETQRQLVVTLAAQTGDQAHVAAAAALDDRTDVLVIFSLDKTKEQAARDASVQYFRQATDNSTTPERVHQICLDSHEMAYRLYSMLVDGKDGYRKDSEWIEGGNKKDIGKINNLNKLRAGEVKSILKYGDKFYKTLNVLSATFIIAERMAAANTVERRTAQYRLFAKRMGSNLDPEIVLKHDDFKGIDFPRGEKRVLLLWGRYTGGNTPSGYNPEGDSDLLGQKQLSLMVEKTLRMFDVIIVGHDLAGTIEKDWVHVKCHVGEFYLKPSIGPSRGRQLSFMLVLMQKYPGKLFQIGQKTDGMDAGAMAGIPTVYIEDIGSGMKTRMQSWVGSVPFYKSALVNEPPTLLGRALRAIDAELASRRITQVRVYGEKGRRWAQYFYVLDSSRVESDHEVDIMALTDVTGFPTTEWVPAKGNAIKDNDEMTEKFKVIDAEIAREAASLQVDGYIVKGYSPGEGDFDLIQQRLVDLVKFYDKLDAVVHSSSGQYVTRSALK